MLLELESRHPVPISPVGGTTSLFVKSGDTVYYADTYPVSASANQGSLTLGGGTVTFTAQVFVISASQSVLNVSFAPPSATAGMSQATADNLYVHQDGTGLPTTVVKSAGGGTLGNYPRDNADGTWSWTGLRPTVALGSSGATSSVALIAQIEKKATLTLTADHVMTVTNLVDGAVLWVEATQDATGGRTLSISDGASTAMVPISTPAAKTSLVAVLCDGANLFVEQVS